MAGDQGMASLMKRARIRKRSKRTPAKRAALKKTTRGRARRVVTLSIPRRDPFYALEKLSQAVDELEDPGAGNLHARLYEAAMYIHRIHPDEIPDEELRRVLVGVK